MLYSHDVLQKLLETIKYSHIHIQSCLIYLVFKYPVFFETRMFLCGNHLDIMLIAPLFHIFIIPVLMFYMLFCGTNQPFNTVSCFR